MKNKLFLILILSNLISLSQEKKLITYKKTIVSPTFNLVLENNKNQSKIEVLNKKTNEISENIIYPSFKSSTVFAAFNNKIWIAYNKNIEILNIKNGKKLESVEIPNGITISQMAIGFNDVEFVIDNQKNSIFVLNKGKFDLLIEDSRLTKTSSLLIFGGTLYVGTENNILAFDISDKKITVYADNLNLIVRLLS